MKANVIDLVTPFTLNGRTYNLKATWNVEAEVQERFGSVKTLLEDKDHLLQNLLSILTILINEAVDIHNDTDGEKWQPVTEKYVGRYIDMSDPAKIIWLIAGVFGASRPETEKSEDGDPNQKTPQA